MANASEGRPLRHTMMANASNGCSLRHTMMAVTAAGYGPTPDAELRLITCAGPFGVATSHYLRNIVVYATESS
jgi:hypothetical protein